ncbi:MAG TPA: hypothetical protein VFN34_01635 [Ornithinibacter sp.]|nr:hypothetical protein [Ornithinibacter sp.]
MPRAAPRHRAPKPPQGTHNVLQAVAVLGAGLTGVAVLTVVAGGPASVGVVSPDGSIVTSPSEPSARFGSGRPTPTGDEPVATGVPSLPPGQGPVSTTPDGTTPAGTTPAGTPSGLPPGSGVGPSSPVPTSTPVTTSPEPSPSPTPTKTHPTPSGGPKTPKPPKPSPTR